MNRLYWVNDQGHWDMVMESDNEQAIKLQAEHCIATRTVFGVCGYAHWSGAPPYMEWTAYLRYEGGCSRRPNRTADIPRPIRLMEMLQ